MYKSNINLNLYKTFYEVAKAGSISKASKQMYTSQPAISRSIKKLEEELNVQLFYRNLSGTELTEKGQELLFYVEEAFNSLVSAERTMIETENLNRGKLSIGVPSHIGTFYIFDQVEKFHKQYPNIEITIISKSTTKLLNLLESHEIDFIIDSSPIKNIKSNMIVKPLTKVQNCFVTKDKKLQDTIHTLKDLTNQQLILPIKGTANRNDLDDCFQARNITVNNVLNIETSEMIIGAVKKELGIGYIIYDLVKRDLETNELVQLEIEDPLPTITINIVYERHFLTTAPRTFIKNFIDPTIEE